MSLVSSRSATRHSSARKKARKVLGPTYAPWDYSRFVVPFAGPDAAESTYQDLAKPLYESIRGRDLALACAVTGSTLAVEMAHLVAAVNGAEEFKYMAELGVVPPESTPDWPANKVALNSALHGALDSPNPPFRLLPQLSILLVRISAELSYREARRQNPVLPQRPPFSLFYERLETESPSFHLVFTELWPDGEMSRTTYDPNFTSRGGTRARSYRTRRTAEDDAASTEPPFPPLVLPLSANLAIWAFWARYQLLPPCPIDLVEVSEALYLAGYALNRFWRSPDSLNDAGLERALSALKCHLEIFDPNNPYLPSLANPHSSTHLAFSPPAAPDDAIWAQSPVIADPGILDKLAFSTSITRGIVESDAESDGASDETSIQAGDSSLEEQQEAITPVDSPTRTANVQSWLAGSISSTEKRDIHCIADEHGVLPLVQE